MNAWRLRLELVSTLVLLWLVRAGRRPELNPDVHRYLWDRYRRLVQHYERAGNRAQAARFEARAREHHRDMGPGGPPFATAMAMPVPRPPLFTWAVSTMTRDPDDAA